MNDSSALQILIVDDNPAGLESLSLLLEDQYSILPAESGTGAIEVFKSHDNIAAVVMDIKMPDMSGIEAAREIRSIAPDTRVIFHTGYPGLYDEDQIENSESPFGYVQKGGPACQIERQIKNAVESYMLSKDIKLLAEYAEVSFGIVGRSEAMRRIYHLIRKTAPTDTKIMILGETGTGKGMIARAIHDCSPRADKPFKKFNCNHTPPDLVESELFGHLKGSFSGAHDDRIGLFEYADGGTVFLDEIGDLSPATQGKLLDILETGEYDPLGWTGKSKKTDVRIICATNRDLDTMVANGEFREDLFYRLRNTVVEVPSLRKRKEDIPLLVDYFIDKHSDMHAFPQVYLDSSALHVLMNHDWPGNVRQLEETIRSTLVMLESQVILESDIREILGELGREGGWNAVGGLAARTREFRRNCIIQALHEAEGNVSSAARLLDVDPSNLRKWIKSYGIPSD